MKGSSLEGLDYLAVGTRALDFIGSEGFGGARARAGLGGVGRILAGHDASLVFEA